MTAILILYLVFLTKFLTFLNTNDLESSGWEPQKHLPDAKILRRTELSGGSPRWNQGPGLVGVFRALLVLAVSVPYPHPSPCPHTMPPLPGHLPSALLYGSPWPLHRRTQAE